MVLIRNPRAGSAESWTELRERAAADGEMEVEVTRGPGDAAKLAARATRDGVRTVVAIGGDGTISEIVQGIGANADTTLGIIPMGTGNDTIRSLGIPEDPAQAFDLLHNGRTRTIDLLEIELAGRTRFVLNTCTGGFSAQVTRSVTDDVKDRWGHFAYLRCAVDVLGEIPEHTVSFCLDGRQLPTEHIVQLVIGNGRFAGHGVAVAPDAVMDDGVFDLLIARSAALPKLLTLVPDVLQKEVPRSELIGSWQGRRLEVRLDPPMPVSLDGEIEEASELSCTVRPGAARVLVPDTPDRSNSPDGRSIHR